MLQKLRELKSDDELIKLLKLATMNNPMSPAEIWRQRISFVYGQISMGNPDIKREDIEKHATEIYGPCPDD